MSNNKKRALVTIDIQEGFHDPVWGQRNNPQFEENILQLLTHWRSSGQLVLHVQHSSKKAESPLHASRPGFKLMDVVAPQFHEPIVIKSVNSAFIGTNLEQILKTEGVSSVIFVGLVTDHCVSTTCRMAANLGFEVLLPEDGTATFDRVDQNGKLYNAELVHSVNMASLRGEFAQITTINDIIKNNRE